MTRLQKSEMLLLFSAIAVSRFTFRSHELYDIDSVNFALAIDRFDPRTYQPHPPGYFLYVVLARGFNDIVHNPNLALVILSIITSCGTILCIYKLALEWFGRREARLASLLFLFSPLAWFHGTVALTYSVEAFFSALLGCLCWRLAKGKTNLVFVTGALLGISAGVRPSSLLLLGPLYVYSLWRTDRKTRIAGFTALFLTLAACSWSMIEASGGLNTYCGALLSLWRMVPSRNTVFNSSPITSFARFCVVIFIGFLSFGVASVALVSAFRRKSNVELQKKRFTLVWTLPALCFFTFIYLRFVNSGYLLLLSAPASIWLGYWSAEWYRHSLWPRPYKLATIAACALVNIFVFLQSPFYCSYRSVRQFEAELHEVETAIPQIGSPNDTLVIGFDSHFLGYRHAGYYLPEYMTVQYPETHLIEGTRVFSMHHRTTQLLESVPMEPYRQFVLAPLPNGDQTYTDYMSEVTKQLPGQYLRTIRIGGKDFITGPIALLPLLFPDTAAHTPRTDVYPPFHAEPAAVYSREHKLPNAGAQGPAELP